MRIYSTKWKIDERNFINEDLSGEWTTHHMSKLTIVMGNINGHAGRNMDGFQGVQGEFSFGEGNQEGRMLSDFF